MLVDIIAGARPNFIKIAPIIDAIRTAQLAKRNIYYRLIHTGQHYDKNMSDNFFEQLSIPSPDINLNVGSGSQCEQTGNIMVGYEKVLSNIKPDLTLVVGDVTSTMACSITAKKYNIKVAHVEAGIRSGDLTMPEEINRIITDALADYFFTTSVTANQNLKKLGVDESKIFFVGNTMIDTLLKQSSRFEKPVIWEELGLQEKGYFVMTLHRPANVDEECTLKALLDAILKSSRGLPLLFPVHPRTAKKLENLCIAAPNLHLIEPLGYLQFNYLVQHAKAVVTDSGGITEEATVMNVPCLTLRNNTERPETCTIGTNDLIGTDPVAIEPAFRKLFYDKWRKGNVPELWDGKTSERIIDHLCNIFKVVPNNGMHEMLLPNLTV